MIEDVSAHLTAIVHDICPDADVIECGIFNKKTELRLAVRLSDTHVLSYVGEGVENPPTGLVDMDYAERTIRKWALKVKDRKEKQ